MQRESLFAQSLMLHLCGLFLRSVVICRLGEQIQASFLAITIHQGQSLVAMARCFCDWKLPRSFVQFSRRAVV
jgi:hypothetical protein